MDNQQNIISSQAKLSAIAGMMFFAPFVKHNLKFEEDLTQDEKNFVLWYVQVGFVNIVFLFILIIALLINRKLDMEVLVRISHIAGWVISVIILFSILACAWEVWMWKEDESIMQHVQHKGELVKAYIPILNFIHWFKQKDYAIPYRRLKESIFVWT